MKTKLIALYLPQFHEIPENNKWWGKGFTEWVAVKNAKKLYEGHLQPKVPLHSNYYDLMQKDTLEMQANLMKEYGIDGLCFYHYYFDTNHMLLEGPAENLLKWKEIDMPFCFSWANESWKRTWSNLPGNQWTPLFDEGMKKEGTGLLVKQEYGDEEDWIAHIRYLIPFFKDKRYIRFNNRPVFVIYIPESIAYLADMLRCWERCLKEEGIDRPYYIGTNCYNKEVRDIMDCIMFQEPQETMREEYIVSQAAFAEAPVRYDYRTMWDTQLNKYYPAGNVCPGAFNGYDDTPRRGKRGSVIQRGTPDEFYKYMNDVFELARDMHSPFVFYNAWNEWGEGMYLEPDEQSGYKYLEVLKKVKRYDFDQKQTSERNAQLVKTDKLYSDNIALQSFNDIARHWITLKERDYKLTDYLLEHGYKKVAIYGLGYWGHLIRKRLIEEDNINIQYNFFERHTREEEGCLIGAIDQIPMDCDCVIVAVSYDYYIIQKEIRERVPCVIKSIKTFLGEVIEYYEE